MTDAAIVREPGTRKGLDVPAGYRMVLKNGLNIVFKEGYAESFDRFVMPEVTREQEGRHARYGRSRLTSLPLAGESNERALVRRCVRGGILGRFLKELYVNRRTPRPLEELRISEYARARGIPTPEVLAAMFERVPPFFYKGALAVREISPSADMETTLLSLDSPAGSETLEKKRRTISLLGQLVAKMHAAGIYHADLHLKNILLSGEEEGSKLYLLDLDAARILDPLSDHRKLMNLLRLYRSAEKVNRRRRVIARTDLFRFLHSYAEESSRPVKELAARLRGMLPFWRVKWKLSDMFGV